MPRSNKGFGAIGSTLLLAVALTLLLGGCGALAGLLKSETPLTAGPPSSAAPAAPAHETPEPAGDAAPSDTAALTTETVAAPEPVTTGAPGGDDVVTADDEAGPLELTLALDSAADGAVTLAETLAWAATRLEGEGGSALAQQAQDPDASDEDYDPWEPFNEKMFSVNRALDRWILKPAARVYRVIMPEPFQVLISNGFDNINFVPRFVNSLLQAKWGGAGREISRFLINSTAGIGGLFDPAKDYWGIQKSREDFGQTLCVWGSGPGPYVIVPLMEPLTVRDGIGKFVDGFMDPLSYVLPFFWDRLGMKVGDTLNDRALNYDLFQGFEESVIDLYSAVRHGYLQRRQQLCKE